MRTGVVDRGATCERIDEGPIKADAGRPGFDDVALPGGPFSRAEGVLGHT